MLVSRAKLSILLSKVHLLWIVHTLSLLLVMILLVVLIIAHTWPSLYIVIVEILILSMLALISLPLQ